MRILLLLAGFVLLNGVCAKPILGVYTGGGNPNLMKAFGQFAGHNASLALDFLSLNDWPGLRGDATQFQAWAAWLNARNDRWFVLSIAMIPLNGGGDLGTGASGGYDSTWEALGASLVQNGLHTRVILRIGWEFNGSWYPWYAGKNPTAWIQYFQRIVNILKKHGPEFKVLWNLQVNWTPLDPTTVWPGGQYVDYIGIDVYDTCYDSKVGCSAYLSNRPEGGTWDSRVKYPANTLVDWNGAFYVNSQDSQGKQPDTGAPWSQAFSASTLQASREATWNNLVNGYDGLAGWAAWAQKQGKPLAIGEMGVFLTQNGGGDDPYYIEQMYNWVTNPANNVAWISYWDYGEQQLSPKDGFQPSKNAAAAFKRTFGTL